MEGGGPILVPFAIGLAVFVIAGALTDLIERTGLLKVPARTALARARGLPRSTWGAAIAHLGLGVTLLGIVGETQMSSERIAEVKPGQSISIRRYELHFDSISNVVEVHINSLRNKVDRGFTPELIHTVRGVGYMLADTPP